MNQHERLSLDMVSSHPFVDDKEIHYKYFIETQSKYSALIEEYPTNRIMSKCELGFWLFRDEEDMMIIRGKDWKRPTVQAYMLTKQKELDYYLDKKLKQMSISLLEGENKENVDPELNEKTFEKQFNEIQKETLIKLRMNKQQNEDEKLSKAKIQKTRKTKNKNQIEKSSIERLENNGRLKLQPAEISKDDELFKVQSVENSLLTERIKVHPVEKLPEYGRIKVQPVEKLSEYGRIKVHPVELSNDE